MTNDLTTTLIAPMPNESDDLMPSAFVLAVKNRYVAPPAYDDATLLRIADRIRKNARDTRLRASVVAGQMCHETRWFRYGGDVDASQYNFAGIGATGDGAEGNGFGSPEAGVDAVFAHHFAYMLGPVSNWPPAAAALAPADPRVANVLRTAHAGKVKLIGDYTNGRWAYTKSLPVGTLDNGYARGIVAASNQLLAQAPAGAAAAIVKPAIITRYPDDGLGDTGQLITTTKYGEGFAGVMVSSHITSPPAGSLSDHGSLRYLTKNPAQASVHFLIGRAGGIFSGGVPLNKTPWTNGVDWDKGPGPASNPWKSDLSNPYIAECVRRRGWFNQLTFTIEHEGYSGDKMTTAQWASTKKLQAWLCAEGRRVAGLGGSIVPKAKLTLVGHYQFDGINRPNCPGWSEKQWLELEADVLAIVNAGAVEPPAGFIGLWAQRLAAR